MTVAMTVATVMTDAVIVVDVVACELYSIVAVSNLLLCLFEFQTI